MFRLEQHFNANGSAWTNHHKPLNILALFPDCDDFDEDKYTLKYMGKYGIDNVRGGSFCRFDLSEIDKQTIQKMLTGTRNLCYTCGNHGHFAKKCTNNIFLEEEQITYEHQRWYPFKEWSSNLLLTDRPQFSSKDGKTELRKESFILQSNQQIVEDWSVDSKDCTDTDGWMYAFVFQDPVYNLKCQSDNFVRRRKWVRIIKTQVSDQMCPISDQDTDGQGQGTDDQGTDDQGTDDQGTDDKKLINIDTSKSNSGRSWDQKEELQLKKMYIDDNLSIESIAQIHNRTPGGIVARLKKLNLLNEPKKEPEKHNDKPKKKFIKCFKCQKFGHTSSTCYSKTN
jgi:hypothetical protein